MRRNRLHICFWEQAPMFRLLLPLAAGIMLYERSAAFKVSPGAIAVTLLTILLLVIFIYSGWQRNRKLQLPYFLSVQLLLIGTGYTVYRQYDQRNDLLWMGRFTGHDYQLAVIAAPPVLRSSSTRLELQLLAGREPSGHLVPVRGRALLYLRSSNFVKGDTLWVPAAWQELRNRGNPFEFDYASWCRRRNIFFRQFANTGAVILAGRYQASAASFIERSHNYCISHIDRHIKDTATAALLKAVITGDESGIDPELRQAYSDTGIIHIISVSGAHVNLLFLSVAFLLRFIRRQRYRWIQFLFSFVLVWFYVLLAGAAAPAVRAALMFSIVSGGILLYRNASALNQLCAAGFIMLLYQPAWLFQAGFQLSFLAILSILLFYAPIRELFHPGNKVLAWLWQSAALSLAAELLVAPLVAYYFHSFPATFLVANIVACLAMSAILVLGVLLVLAGTVPVLPGFIAFILVRISTIFHTVILWLQEFSPAALRQLQLSTAGLLLLYIFIAGTGLFLIARLKTAVWPALTALLLLCILSLYTARQSLQQQIFIVYNSKGCQADLVSGNSYSRLSGDSTALLTRTAMRTGFHCHRDAGAQQIPLLQVAGRTLLLWDHPQGVRYPVDIVILKSWSRDADLDSIRSYFNPGLLVISGGLNKRQARLIRQQCDSLRLPCHDVQEQGAFILRATYN